MPTATLELLFVGRSADHRSVGRGRHEGSTGAPRTEKCRANDGRVGATEPRVRDNSAEAETRAESKRLMVHDG
jgi:hypothetical protein